MRITTDQCMCCRYLKPEAAIGRFYVHLQPLAGEDWLYVKCLDCYRTYALDSAGKMTITQGAIEFRTSRD
jgi:hypothetical protein